MIRLVVVFLSAMLLSPTSMAWVSVWPHKKLEMVTNDSLTDNFYSVEPSQIQEAMNYYGYYGRQSVGFVMTGLGMDVASQFNRLFKGSPAIDHFYTTRSSDVSAAISYGYTHEGYEGMLRTSQITGTVPLYRLSYFWPGDGSVMHWYGTDAATRVNMINQGWFDEGIEGYIWPQPQPNVPLVWPSRLNISWSQAAGTIIVQSNGVSDPDNSSDIRCGGPADLYRDGIYAGTVNFDYRYIPGSSNLYGCIYVAWGWDLPGAHTYRADWTGYTAYRRGAFFEEYVSQPPEIREVVITR